MQGVYDEVVQRLRTEVIDVDGAVTTRWTFGWDLAALAAGSPVRRRTSRSPNCCATLPAPRPRPRPMRRTRARRRIVGGDSDPPVSLSDVEEVSGAGGTMTGAPAEPMALSPAKQLINCADLAGRPDAAALASLMPPADQPDTPLPASVVLMYVPMCSGYPEAWAPSGP